MNLISDTIFKIVFCDQGNIWGDCDHCLHPLWNESPCSTSILSGSTEWFLHLCFAVNVPTSFLSNATIFCIFRSCPCAGRLWGASMGWTWLASLPAPAPFLLVQSPLQDQGVKCVKEDVLTLINFYFLGQTSCQAVEAVSTASTALTAPAAL